MICPIQPFYQIKDDKEKEITCGKPCLQLECPWWCAGEKECSIKVLALDAIKRGEK